MTKTTDSRLLGLPLIALLSLSLAACGGDDSVDMDGDGDTEGELLDAEPDMDGLNTRADMDMDGDTEGELFDAEPDMDGMAMGDDTMMGGMADAVVITVSGFQQGAGEVYVALQDETIFGTGDATYGGSAQPGMDNEVEIVIGDVTPGDYAVAAFQDTNGNGMLDLGANGIPTEPWALSNSAGTQGPPEFDNAMMTFDGMDDRADLQLSGM